MRADLQEVAGRSGLPGSPPWVRALRWARPLAAAAIAVLWALAQPALAEQVDYSRFDHTSTGFPLRGQHQNLKCEQCHLSGVFEGTPRACSVCHIQGNPRSAMYMPANHIPLQSSVFRSADCSDCHTENSFGGAHFSHSNVSASSAVVASTGYGSCITCHNGTNATGKPAKGHPQTNATGGAALSMLGFSCDVCHSRASFAGAFATFPIGHIPTGQACSLCHSGGYSLTLTQMVHTGITGNCTVCHAADAPATNALQFTMTFGTASGYPVTLEPTSQNYHPPTSSFPSHFTISESCEACHKTPTTPMAPMAAAGGFAGGVMTHAGITSGCARCHYNGSTPGDIAFLGITAKGPPGTAWAVGAANHIPIAGAACEACHSPTSTSTGGFKINASPQLSASGHAVVSSVPCATCHATGAAFYGVTGLVTQLSNHIPIGSASCSASGCHASDFAAGGFKITASPVLSVAGHAVVAGSTCDSCHENNAADLAFQGVGTNIYVRPGAAAVGLSKADPAHATGTLATQDCAQCHGTTPPFAGGTLPAAHVPLPTPQPACAICHAAGYGVGLSTMVHSSVKSETCTTCHGAGKGPFSGTSQGAGGQPKQPPGTVGASGAGNHIPVGSADCGTSCHASSDQMTGTGFLLTGTTPLLSATGHTAVNTLKCGACHNSGMAWYGVATLVVPPGTVGTLGAANHIALGTGDCSTCHGSTIAVGAFKIGSTPSLATPGHQAVASVTCASCHATGAAWYGVTSLVTQLASHIPIGTASCNASGCHTSNYVTGGFHLTGTPGTASAVLTATGHTAVASQACTSCHENNAANLTFQGVLGQIYLRPGNAAAGLSPVDATHATGTLATQDCSQCHNTTGPFVGNKLPTNHIPLPATGAGATCSTCHASGYSPALSKMVHSAVTTVAGGCTACHGSGKGPFSGSGAGTGGQPVQPPGTVGTSGAANHVPVSTADCSGCHATTDTESGTGFKLTTSPLLSSTGHTAVNALKCGACHNSGMAWYGVATLVVPPGTVGTLGAANHIALGTGDCSTCHGSTIAVGAFKIGSTPSLAAAGHAAVSSVTCASCHGTGAAWYGVPSLVTQLASHIPIGTATCNASGCHASSFVTGGFHITGTPGTASAQLTAAGHTSVASMSCNTCHENNAANLTFQGVLGQIYLRPGATVAGLSPVDAAHATGTLAAPNDCATCHNTTGPFTGSQLPGNHFPLPTPQPACADCHAAGYGVGKSIMKHTDVASETCTTCHGSGKGPFAGTSQGAGGQPKQPPGTVGTSGTANHIPVGSADCGTACHKSSDVMNGTGFVLAMLGNSSAHGAVSSLACTSCHGSGMAWYGATTLKTPPGTPATFPCTACSPSAANHIPVVTTDACTVCHASASTYTTFAGGAMNHAGISSGCASCHATGGVWYGVTNLVTQLANHIPINAGVDCATCHGQNFGTGGFKIASSPVLSTANHAYVSTTCTTCHENNAADLAFQGVSTSIYVRPGALAVGLSPIDLLHAVGNLLSQDCSSCHTTTPPFTGNTEPSNHIPTGTGANCAANCHKGGFTAAGTVMDHADPSVSGTACVTCHGKGKGPFYGTAQSQAGGQPMQPPGTVGVSGAANHIPMGTGSLTCNTGCHTAAPPTTAVSGGFSFAMKGNTAAHQVVVNGANCDTCHESALAWYLDSIGGKIRTRPNGHHTGTDCGSPNGCHAGQYNGFGGAAAAAAAKATKARPTSGLTKRIPATPPGIGASGTSGPVGRAATVVGSGPYSHLGIPPGTCRDCHSPGGGASAMPGGHLMTLLSCDSCHRTTAWKPVTYTHSGVGPSQCAGCHAGPNTWATPKPAGHFVTYRSCDKCHHTTASWVPVMYDHLSPRYRPQPGILACIGCHTTNTEMIVPGAAKLSGRKAVPGGPIR
jgi:hypothetical protein